MNYKLLQIETPGGTVRYPVAVPDEVKEGEHQCRFPLADRFPVGSVFQCSVCKKEYKSSQQADENDGTWYSWDEGLSFQVSRPVVLSLG